MYNTHGADIARPHDAERFAQTLFTLRLTHKDQQQRSWLAVEVSTPLTGCIRLRADCVPHSLWKTNMADAIEDNETFGGYMCLW